LPSLVAVRAADIAVAVAVVAELITRQGIR
jgi:hypothetical protein